MILRRSTRLALLIAVCLLAAVTWPSAESPRGSITIDASRRSNTRPIRRGRLTARRSRSSGTPRASRICSSSRRAARRSRSPISRSTPTSSCRTSARSPGCRTSSCSSARTGSCGPCRRRDPHAGADGWTARRCRGVCALAGSAADRVRAARPDLDRLGRGENAAAADEPSRGPESRGAGVLEGRPLARVHRVARRARAGGPALERADGASMENVDARTARRHRLDAGRRRRVDPVGRRGERRPVHGRWTPSSTRSCRPTARRARSRRCAPAAPARALARSRRALVVADRPRLRSCWCRPTANRSRSSAIAPAGFTST